MTFMQEISEKIKNALIKKGMSQKDFAELSGLTDGMLSDIINCKRKRLHFKTVLKINETLNILK